MRQPHESKGLDVTSYGILFIVMVLGIGFIAWLILFMRSSFEPVEADNTEDIEKALREQYNWQKERAGLDRLDELLMLEDDSLEETSPPTEPLSNAGAQAIEWLSREDDWL